MALRCFGILRGGWAPCLSLLMTACVAGCAEPAPSSDAPHTHRMAGAVRPDVWTVSFEGWLLDSESVAAAAQGDPLDVPALHALARSLGGSTEELSASNTLLFLVSDGTRFPVRNEGVDQLLPHFGQLVHIDGKVDRWGRLTVTASEQVE